MSKYLSLFITFLIISCSTNKGNVHTLGRTAFKDSLKTELDKIYEKDQFVGYSVAIVNDKGVLYQNGIGYANAESKEKYTEHTIQNIGSISKTLVGVALLKAQELGKINLDDPINKYLPFKVDNPYFPFDQITIRNLATHTSTITDNKFYLKRNYILKPNQNLVGLKLALEDEQVFNSNDSLLNMSSFLQNVLAKDGKWYSEEDYLKYKPGEIFEYSNVATALAAYIIEVATGEPFNEFTNKHILIPLKMNSSGWKFHEIDFTKYSRLYHKPYEPLPFYSLITYPDGNFITSANDLSKFLTELIKGYSGNGTLLSKESYDEYYKQQLKAANFRKRNVQNPYSDEYNIGIFIGFSVAGNIGHTGGDPGVASIMFFNPQNKIGRILLVNTNINDKKGNDQFYAIWNILEKYQYKLTN
jgi:CubicO group peptidase (beta-lactamase class C family)